MKFLKKIFAILIIFQANLAYSDWSEIDWASCGPNTIARRLTLATDSKKFWITQSVKIESILQENVRVYEGNRADCLYGQGSDKRKLACIERLENTIKNIDRCLDYANKMCRIHGGFC